MIIKGTCRECGKPAKNPNGTYCQECLDKHKEYRKKLIQSGVCPYCKKSIFSGTMCEECKEKSRERWKRIREDPEYRADFNRKQAESRKKKRAERKEQGICTRCGKRKAITGRTLCTVCAVEKNNHEKAIRYRSINKIPLPRNEWIDYGLCYRCGEENDNYPFKKLCSKCCKEVSRNFDGKRGLNSHWKKSNELLFARKDT